MKKREYILREEALSHPFANGKYDRKNANIDFILGCESYKEWLETFPAFTEQDIVKSILYKIREEVESIEYYGTNNGNDFWLRTPDEIKKDVLAILDKHMSESEVKDGNDD